MTASAAAVVRCHACNVQTTYINGEAPENCETCARPLERRQPATVTVEAGS